MENSKEESVSKKWNNFIYECVMRIERCSRIAYQGYEDMEELLTNYGILCNPKSITDLKIKNLQNLVLELRYLIDNSKNNLQKFKEVKIKIDYLYKIVMEGVSTSEGQLFIYKKRNNEGKKSMNDKEEIELTKLYYIILDRAYELKLLVTADLEEIIGNYERGVADNDTTTE